MLISIIINMNTMWLATIEVVGVAGWGRAFHIPPNTKTHSTHY